ncbi:protein TsetseEP-like [Leptopilina heterotoma]|uniref:protein TsetseEP-like n=1 Tax=Leptopilina heterotoma TaxID=63436 RepID=UPI001CA98817|nr:protein TsetseEP-like [Leptopilina heterotoma]
MSKPGRRKKDATSNFMIDPKTRKASLVRLKKEAKDESRTMTRMFNSLFRAGRPEGCFCGECQLPMVEIPRSEFHSFDHSSGESESMRLSGMSQHFLSGFAEIPVETQFSSSPEPQAGPSSEPQTGVSWEPQAGPSSEPQTGVSWEPQAGPSSEPQTGVSWEPQAGPSSEPQTGVSWEPQAGPSSEPQTGKYQLMNIYISLPLCLLL